MARPLKEELIKYGVEYLPDTDYAAFARLLQSKWRDKKGFPFIKYGNFLEAEFAKTSKANYLTDNIKQLVTNAVLNSELEGAMISEPRIWNNLLSSQPLCFNLFGEFHYNINLATKYFKTLFPSRIEKVTSVKFEYSAGRKNKQYTGDSSAFDAFIEYTTKGKRGFIGIEVKYSESLLEETTAKADDNFNRHQERYTNLTSDLYFKPNAIETVKQVPLSQIWRDHMLSLAHLKDYEEGFFVFLFPQANLNCLNAVKAYQNQLVSNNEIQTGFYPRYLDYFIKTLKNIHNTDWTKELEERYLGISLINMNIENFKLAHHLNENYKELLLEENVHFRASLNSLSLISISNDRPELGVKCNLTKFKANNDIEALIKENLVKINLKSISENKPEKKLQAYIINYALNHHQLPFNYDIKFITSELALKNGKNKKVVTDILGFNVKTNQLCVIELKSDRLLKRLIEQVDNFENIIKENPEFFSELLSIHGYQWQNESPNSISKIVVWKKNNSKTKKTELESKNILEYTYEVESIYKFL